MAGSNNAIGSAAVILSANADRLTSGLDKSKKHVNDWAGAVDKKLANVGKASSKGGGLFGRLLGSGVAGGAAGLAAGGIMGAVKLAGRLPDIVDRLSEKAGDTFDGKALSGLSQTFDRLTE